MFDVDDLVRSKLSGILYRVTEIKLPLIYCISFSGKGMGLKFGFVRNDIDHISAIERLLLETADDGL